MPEPIARWNFVRGVWETGQTLVCGHLELYSEIWTTSGSMRNGVCYQRPPLAHPTAESESSLLPTPDAAVFNDGQSVQVWQERKARELAKGYNGNGGGTPLAMLVRLLPTPQSREGDQSERGMSPTTAAKRMRAGRRNLDDAVALLPTPRATDGEKGGPSQQFSDGTPALAAIAAALLPTPTVGDSVGARNATVNRTHPGKHHSGQTLTDVFWTGPDTSQRSNAGGVSSDDQPQLPLF